MEECLEQEASGLAEVRELEQATDLEVSGVHMSTSVSLHDNQ